MGSEYPNNGLIDFYAIKAGNAFAMYASDLQKV